ncbi:MAG: DUF882 domain-containing protein [Nitratireductor sp.]|nr:DUF882 domain-containing protein [Nitratireductor sp.]
MRRLLLPLVAALMLSGCVGSQVTNTLESVALESPDMQDAPTDTSNNMDGSALAATDTPGDAASPFALPVPIKSPGYDNPALNAGQSLALLPDDENPAAAAAEALAEAQPAGETAVAAAEPPAAQPVSRTVTQPVKPVRTVSAVQKPKKAGGLFDLFMAPRKAQAPRPAAGSGTQLALLPEAQRQRPSAGGNDLPGVQRQSAIFGINEGGNEAEDDGGSADGVQVASVGSLGRLISPSGLILQTSKVEVGCLKPELLSILGKVERRYGKKVMVTSGYRSPTRNRRAGGVSNSTHIYCKAADIQVEGVSKWDLAKYLRSVEGRGGVGTYCRTNSVHIDVGSQRDWHHPCRRSGSRAKKKA